MSTQFGFIGAGKVRCAGEQYPVHNPYDETVIAVVHRAQPADIDDAITADIDDAITAAVEAFEAARRLPGYRRSEILSRVIQGARPSERSWHRQWRLKPANQSARAVPK